jgi:hypothetical protein
VKEGHLTQDDIRVSEEYLREWIRAQHDARTARDYAHFVEVEYDASELVEAA